MSHLHAGPLVSTIIPTYNRASLVCKAIDSVRRQTYGHVEIIVVDDGSTDDTRASLQRYGDEIRVIVQDNMGPSAARNRGIAASRGEIVAFLDSDDTWSPTKLERQVSVLTTAGDSVVCCLCNATVLGPEGSTTTSFDLAGLQPALDEGVWKNVTEVLATRFVMFTQMAAIRRSALERVGGFNENLWVMEDYDLSLRLSLDGPWAYLAEPLVTYHQDSPGSLAARGEANQLRLIRSALQARQNLYDQVCGNDAHQHLRSACHNALRVFKRELRAIELRRRPSRSDRILGAVLLRVGHYRRALHRRSPWYPKMDVTSVSVARRKGSRPCVESAV